MTSFDVFAWMGWGAFVAQLGITLVWMRRAMVTKRLLNQFYERVGETQLKDMEWSKEEKQASSTRNFLDIQSSKPRFICQERDSNGVQCELELGHRPRSSCEAPRALQEFLLQKKLRGT